jgi:chromosome segregation ATPase
MKTLHILCVLCILTSLSGCKYKNEALELQKQNEDLAIQLDKSDSLSNVYRSTLREIEAAFDSIMPVDASLDATSEGRKLTTRLTNKLNEVNDLINEKEKKYYALNSRLIGSNKMVSDLSVKIEELNSEVRRKDSINVNLNQNIAGLEKKIADQSSLMDSVIQEKRKLNDAFEKKTNTVFFIADSERVLRDKEIIEKTGGFLGFLGRVNTLNPELDKNQLEMIDIR